MNDSSYDVAVIGAGHNGLILSAYLAQAGLKVVLLERRHETGGGLDTLEFSGFKFNMHAIYHLMADVMPCYQDFALSQKGVRYLFPEVQIASLANEFPPVILYRDPQKTAQYLTSAFSQKQGDAYLRMYSDFKAFSEQILIPLTYVPAVPALDLVRQLSASAGEIGRRFNAVAELTALEILESYEFEDPVKACILNLFAMWGLSPLEAIGYLFPLYVYRMTRAALCLGGSHRLSSALHKTVVAAGGEIRDTAEVVQIRLSDKRANGVVLEDGTEINAKAVVSTVDPKQTFLSFFSGEGIPADLVKRANQWQWEKITFFGVHAALKQAPQYRSANAQHDVQKAMISFLGLSSTPQLLDHIEELENGRLSENPIGHATCTSLFDPISAFKGHHTGRWECLAPFDADWEAIQKDYAAACIKSWKAWAPNLDPLFTLSYPPSYIEKKIKNMVKGSFKHGDYTPLQMGYFRPSESCSQVFTPIDGLYVCGASTYPGGMILGGGGYIGANVIAEDFGVAKTWKEPEFITSARQAGVIA
jgi:phytoene dehydrogenase-like protein